MKRSAACDSNIPRTLCYSPQGPILPIARLTSNRLLQDCTCAPSQMDQSAYRIRKRIPQSCKRCRRRKQKCMGSPICANCQDANLPCERSNSEPQATTSASERYHGVSKDLLFSRIEILEAQLDAISAEYAASRKSQFSDMVDHMALGHVVGEETAHIGSSSGKMIAASLDLMMKDAVQMNILSDAGSREDWHGPRHTFISMQQPQYAGPSDQAGLRYIQAYFGNLHRRLPFLDRTDLLQLHARRNQQHALDPVGRWEVFKLFMVYAIGSAMQKAPQEYESPSSDELFQVAMAFKDPDIHLRSIHNLEGMMLLIIYNLRSTSSSSIWYLIGQAMRTAVDLGLHREANYATLEFGKAQPLRRLFWRVYALDRHIAWSLGRPFSIPDHDIDVTLPEVLEPRFEILVTCQPTDFERENLSQSLDLFVHSIKLSRLRSKIHSSIYRADMDKSLLLPMVPTLLSSMNEYQKSLPASLSGTDKEWILMHWNNGIRMILQPFLNELPQDHELIHLCVKVSGQMCQRFSSMRRKDYLGWGYILVNFIFMAGLTICYCLLRCPQLWSTAISDDLNACSSILNDAADRSMCVKKYRDLWEAVISHVMKTLEQMSGLSQSTMNDHPQSVIGMGIPNEDQRLLESFSTGSHGLQPCGYTCDLSALQPDIQFSDYLVTDNDLSQYADFGAGAVFNDTHYDFSGSGGASRNTLPLKGNELMVEVQNVLSEDIWTGDTFSSQMLTELVSGGSGG